MWSKFDSYVGSRHLLRRSRLMGKQTRIARLEPFWL
jgi:hypothetical protein